MSDISVGTCGNCGGAVTIPFAWYGVTPPTPICRQCGAIPIDAHGPVRKMKHAKDIRITYSGNSFSKAFVDGIKEGARNE